MDDEDKSTIFSMLEKVELHSRTYNKALISARMKNAVYILPKAKAKIRNPPLTAIEKFEDS